MGQAVTDFTERPTNFLDQTTGRTRGGGAPMPKSTVWKDSVAEGERAIDDLGQRRASEAKMGASAEDSDPNSGTSQAWRMVLTRMAPDLAERLKTATAAQMRQIAPNLEKVVAEQNEMTRAGAAAKAKAEQQAKTDAEKGAALLTAKTNRAEDVGDRRAHTKATEDLAASNNRIALRGLEIREGADARDATKDAAAAAEKAKGHQLSPSTLTDLSDAKTAIAGLDSLGKAFEALEMDGTFAKYAGKATDILDLQGTDAAEYKAAALRGMQGVGKIMEGGKLATSDEDKYRRMLPRAGDSKDIARKKIAESKAFLSELVQNRINVLREAGYNVPDLTTGPSTGGPAGKAVDHYLVSPDKKRRVPVYADGTEGPEEGA